MPSQVTTAPWLCLGGSVFTFVIMALASMGCHVFPFSVVSQVYAGLVLLSSLTLHIILDGSNYTLAWALVIPCCTFEINFRSAGAKGTGTGALGHRGRQALAC